MVATVSSFTDQIIFLFCAKSGVTVTEYCAESIILSSPSILIASTSRGIISILNAVFSEIG